MPACGNKHPVLDPDAQPRQIVHTLDRRKLKDGLAALDHFRNWLIREAA